MNAPSNAAPASRESQVVLPAVIPATRLMYWSVRRELWESRSIYIAPLAAAGLFLFGFLISSRHLPSRMRAALALTPMQQQHELIEQPFTLAALLLMGTAFIVQVFYCLDALHGERRDRSILFWKSLPVSDLTTVLSKACVPIVIVPLLTFVVTLATQWIMLLVTSAVLLGNGLSVATLWTHLPLFDMSLMLFFHLIGIHALWYAPIYGWLLLVSGWARRAALLWATLPLFAIGIVEKITFNTTYFAALMGSRFGPGREGLGSSKAMGMSMAMLGEPGLWKLLSDPGLWSGLAFAAVFLAVAVRLRRYREPI